MDFSLWLEVNELILPDLFEKIKDLKGEYAGVHFSNSDQLSFNLKPIHSDPIGIYIFPKKYILDGGLKVNTMFASYPYAFLIEPTSNARILNLNMSYQEAEYLLIQMDIDKMLLYGEEIYHNSSKNTPGHRFWGVLENVRNTKKLSKNFSWNNFFKKTKYNVIYDPGLGIIHYNEPNQILYLDHKAYSVIDVVKNQNNYSLLIKFASYFPEFKIYKQKKSNWDKKYSKIKLNNNNITIEITTNSYNFNEILISIYGYEEKFEENFNINSNEELLNLVNIIKNFIKNSKPQPSYFTKENSDIILKISKYYNLKMDEKYPLYLVKKYKKNTNFKLKYIKSKNTIVLEIENSDDLWKYIYYSESVFTTIPETIKNLLYEIKEKINNEENSNEKYIANYALKFIEFIEKRVFVKRS